MLLDEKRSSMKLVTESDDFTIAVRIAEKNRAKQLKNRCSSNVNFSNPENSPNDDRNRHNEGFSDIEINME